ncbi:MAG: hypothetical protein ACTSU8_06480, partial [Alphaproteobacteria bacterium]
GDRLIDAARGCRDLWHGLQERGGTGKSDDRTSPAEAKEAQEQEITDTAQEVAAAPVTPEATAPEVADLPPGEPYIETPRCTTCNECTEINNKMFVYNENMQAYIADPDAGSYRQMIEAAESCQVCIIHPGKPRDPNESNLDELIARAESFNAPPG